MDWGLPSSFVHRILQAEDLPNPGIKLRIPTLQANSLPCKPQGNLVGPVVAANKTIDDGSAPWTTIWVENSVVQKYVLERQAGEL